MIRVLDSAGSTLVEWGRQQQHDDVMIFLDLLYSIELTQHVTYLTHAKGHVLDLIIIRTGDTCVTGIDYDWLLPSVHCSIHFTTTFTKPRYDRAMHSSRKIRHSNVNILASTIESVNKIERADHKTMFRIIDSLIGTNINGCSTEDHR